MSNAMDMALDQRPDRQVGSIYGHGRQIHQDTHALVADLQAAAAAAQHLIIDRMKHQPCTTLIVAAGVGYVLGGGLSSRLTRVLIGAGTRLAGAIAAHELTAWMDAPRDSKAV